MTEPIKKLVSMEYTVEEPFTVYEVGDKYTILIDPETGLHYEPVPGWYVEGEDLTDLFRIYPPPKEEDEKEDA